MIEYPKTENVFVRSPTTHKLRVGVRRSPEFSQVTSWLVTEKIDGTNIRLCLVPDEHGIYRAEVRGRSDAATLPKNFIEEALGRDIDTLANDLYGALKVLVGTDDLEADPDVKLREMPLALTAYGEGYGPGIQKGGSAYAPKKSLRLFDVVTQKARFGDGQSAFSPPLWRTWSDVETVAEVLGLKTAPVLGDGLNVKQITGIVQHGPISRVARDEGENIVPMEGVIARTDPYLFTYRGARVMFKLKGKDLPVDEQCSGPGFSHGPHGNCSGYSTDRT